MIVEGDIDDTAGGLGVIEAAFLCFDYDIKVPISFYIDTGSSVTTLGHKDALKASIPFDKLEESKQPIITGNGEVFPYIIHSCSIVFEQDQTSILEQVRFMFVLKPAQPDGVSTLGLDVLARYKISFDSGRKKVILER